MIGFQCDKDARGKAQEIIFQDEELAKSSKTLEQAPEQIPGQPAGMEMCYLGQTEFPHHYHAPRPCTKNNYSEN